MDDVTHRDVAFGLAGLAILRRLPHDPAGIRDIVAMYEALDFGQPLLPSREVDPITGYAGPTCTRNT